MKIRNFIYYQVLHTSHKK